MTLATWLPKALPYRLLTLPTFFWFTAWDAESQRGELIHPGFSVSLSTPSWLPIRHRRQTANWLLWFPSDEDIYVFVYMCYMFFMIHVKHEFFLIYLFLIEG